jgi:cytidyltransferase-like protein
MWIKNNYGGRPTQNVGTKRAIFIGRFQPYHMGHIELVNQKLKSGVPILILVRDIPPDIENPFTTDQTIQMIRKYHESKEEDVVVIAIPDIESVNFGRGVGFEVNEFLPPSEISQISATKIRELAKLGDNSWRRMVAPSIQGDVIRFLLDQETI